METLVLSNEALQYFQQNGYFLSLENLVRENPGYRLHISEGNTSVMNWAGNSRVRKVFNCSLLKGTKRVCPDDELAGFLDGDGDARNDMLKSIRESGDHDHFIYDFVRKFPA